MRLIDGDMLRGENGDRFSFTMGSRALVSDSGSSICKFSTRGDFIFVIVGSWNLLGVHTPSGEQFTCTMIKDSLQTYIHRLSKRFYWSSLQSSVI